MIRYRPPQRKEKELIEDVCYLNKRQRVMFQRQTLPVNSINYEFSYLHDSLAFVLTVKADLH